MPDIISKNRRILLVDDQEQIHEDYRKILALEELASAEFDDLAADFFGENVDGNKIAESKVSLPEYNLASAFQGQEAFKKIEQSIEESKPFALSFMDVRMPPGWDGIETIKRILEIDQDIQFVIATAYADYVWEDIFDIFGANDNIVFLRKPFDATEVQQLASTLSEKWDLSQRARLKMEELEALVGVRTHELEKALNDLRSTQGQLIQSEKMASLGRLVAGLAHEINTPIGAITSSNDVISRATRKIDKLLNDYSKIDTRFDSRVVNRTLTAMKQSNKVTHEAAGRISELITGLKNFSRLDEAEYQMINLNDSIKTTLSIIKHEIGDKIQVDCDYGEIPEILCFAGELNQVFLNLISNASKAIDGEGTISIKTSKADKNVIVSVTDTGRGIDPKNIKNLFDIGFTENFSRIKMGWGLATCYQIIKRHNGEISVESKVGKGSTFTIKLPIK
ncbi:MAG: hybrid sensor histidine kinase/response regulator [Candidatus Electryonea clarkiae]|nr:hybrid sensor histidine kinase/response regulator [Candidatus Electryonea clarkiae]MDP8285768.1 hybrid sensor histidine kinase/response regulator [Candidatus Electryonea clarkiae]